MSTVKHIEVFEEHATHYAYITFTDGRKCCDTPEYDSNDPDNLPETLRQYAQRMSNEWEGATVYMGAAPYCPPLPSPDKPIAKYREQVGAILGHFLLYPGDVTERVSKTRYAQTHVPEREQPTRA